MRHVHRELEYHYGHGLVGLIHPVTNEFNHEAVIRRRGGRHESESMGTLGDYGIHHALGAIHGLVEANGDKKWQQVGKIVFDRYDATSFWYGFIVALSENKNDIANNYCFQGAFELTTQMDILMRDLQYVFNNWKLWNLLVYTPMKIFNNGAAVYEYCNLYIYISQLALVVQYDYGFISELVTRWSILITEDLQPMLNYVYGVLSAENIDYFLIGGRFGLFWKLAFDTKL